MVKLVFVSPVSFVERSGRSSSQREGALIRSTVKCVGRFLIGGLCAFVCHRVYVLYSESIHVLDGVESSKYMLFSVIENIIEVPVSKIQGRSSYGVNVQ